MTVLQNALEMVSLYKISDAMLNTLKQKKFSKSLKTYWFNNIKHKTLKGLIDLGNRVDKCIRVGVLCLGNHFHRKDFPSV